MDLVSFKLLSALTTFAVGWAGVALPWTLRSSDRLLSLGNMLSAGTMLGGGLLHLLPDAVETIAPAFDFPVGYLLFALGLLAPLVVETLVVDNGAAGKPTTESFELDDLRSGGSCSACESSSDDAMDSHAPHALHAPHAHGEELSRTFSKLPLSSAMVLLFALSFHSVLEGLAQGSAVDVQTGVVLLMVILLHKGLAAFALGCLFYDASLSRTASLGLGTLFAAATPAGTIAGMLLHREGDGLLPSCFVALAGGSFTFVALIEILPRELHGNRGGVAKTSKLTALALGFGAMALLAVWL